MWIRHAIVWWEFLKFLWWSSAIRILNPLFEFVKEGFRKRQRILNNLFSFLWLDNTNALKQPTDKQEIMRPWTTGKHSSPHILSPPWYPTFNDFLAWGMQDQGRGRSRKTALAVFSRSNPFSQTSLQMIKHCTLNKIKNQKCVHNL